MGVVKSDCSVGWAAVFLQPNKRYVKNVRLMVEPLAYNSLYSEHKYIDNIILMKH